MENLSGYMAGSPTINRRTIFQNRLNSSYMRVEDVLRYLNKSIISCTQYQVEGIKGNVFTCEDVKNKIGENHFRIMECSVTQYIFVK